MKRISFKLAALGLSFAIGVTSVAINPVGALAKENKTKGKYPIAWDLTLLYKSEDEVNADYEKADKLLDEVESYKGTLNTAENIYNYFQFVEFTDYAELYAKMDEYCTLGEIFDASDGKIARLRAKLNTLNGKKNTVTAFAEPEIFQMSLDERKKIFSDPVFKDLTYWLRKYTDPDYKPLSEEEKIVLSTLEVGQGYTEKAYNTLMNVDLPYPTIIMPDGTEQELNDAAYDDIVYGKDYDDEFKAKANEIYVSRDKGAANTAAKLLEGKMQEEYAKAKIKGFDTTMEYSFSEYDMDTSVYNMLIDAAHEACPDYQRFLNTHKKALGLEKQRPYNLATSASDYFPEKVEYDDAMDEIMDALSVLGDDYIDIFKKILTSGHIDAYPAETKQSGAAMDQTYYKDLPWVFYNYTGFFRGRTTLAHEMGHAVYGELSVENQPVQYVSPTIFTHEVASMTNELLYCSYKLKNAKDDEEKLYYLEELINEYTSAFFGQMMFAEFEDYAYKKVEAGEGLDVEDISEKYYELLHTYRADCVENFDDSRYGWVGVPHFYQVYYVYQYSADIVYATAIAGRIADGEEGAVEEYKDFLKLGKSDSPVNLLKKAGVDPLSKDTYDYAMEYYKKLVDQYEELVNAKK